MGKHGTYNTVDVDHFTLNINSFAAFKCRFCQLDQRIVEGLFQTMVLVLRSIDFGTFVHDLRRGKNAGEIQSTRFPVLNSVIFGEEVNATNHLINSANAEFGHDLA